MRWGPRATSRPMILSRTRATTGMLASTEAALGAATEPCATGENVRPRGTGGAAARAGGGEEHPAREREDIPPPIARRPVPVAHHTHFAPAPSSLTDVPLGAPMRQAEPFPV
jgi:hypothetical protein